MNLPGWILSQLDWRSEPGLWLLGSFLLAVMSANIGWLISRAPGRAIGTTRVRLRNWSGSQWLLLLLRWAYLVGPAYATLLLGILSAQQLGIGGIDWVQGAGVGGALAAATLVLLSLGWWSYRRALPPQDGHGQLPPKSLPRLQVWVVAALEAAAWQLHWAFYRGAISVVPWLSDDYWACWAGLAVEAVQWAMDPWLRQQLRRPLTAERIVRRGILALVTTALFVITRNLWLCWIVHALFEGWAASYGEASS